MYCRLCLFFISSFCFFRDLIRLHTDSLKRKKFSSSKQHFLPFSHFEFSAPLRRGPITFGRFTFFSLPTRRKTQALNQRTTDTRQRTTISPCQGWKGDFYSFMMEQRERDERAHKWVNEIVNLFSFMTKICFFSFLFFLLFLSPFTHSSTFFSLVSFRQHTQVGGRREFVVTAEKLYFTNLRTGSFAFAAFA